MVKCNMAYPLFNIRFILLISASFIAIFSSIAIYFCLPLLISHMIRIQITLSPTSGSFNNWRLNSVTDQIYLYNITNLSDLKSESSSVSRLGQPRQIPRLQQIGPFTFRQDREKVNIQFDNNNETVVYDQKRKWTFMPELSLVKSTDEMNSMWINHMSVSLAGTTMNPEYGEIIDPIVAENDLRLFLNHSVNALLFEGYWDLLMEQAKASGQVDVDRFGWMHNQNNSISKSIRIFTGPSNATLDKFGSVDQYDHKRQFSVWRDNGSSLVDFSNVRCNEFRFGSAGEFFPPPENSLISFNNHHNYNNHQQQQPIKDSPSTKADSDNNQGTESISSKSLSSSSSAAPSTAADGPSELGATPRNSHSASGQVELERHAHKDGKSISMFMPDLCRTIQLYYNGSYYFRGLLVDRYIANEYTFVYPANSNRNSHSKSNGYSDHNYNNKLVESNKCYCNYNETSGSTSCPPNGMMDLFSCRKGSPVSISFPHFLYSTSDESLAPILRLFTDDVEANLDEHQFFIDLEATLNVPVNVQIVFQFNVHLRNDQSMNFTKEYTYLFEDPLTSSIEGPSSVEQMRDLYLPQMWIKSTAQIDDVNLKSLKFIQKHLALVTPITTMIIFGFASILLMASAKLAYDLTYGPNSGRKSISCDHESCSCLDGDHNQCSFLDAKKKNSDMQLLASEKSSTNNHQIFNNSSLSVCAKSKASGGAGDCMKFIGHDTQNTNHVYPSTSKKANNYVISTSSLRNGRVDCVESQPLNR